MPVFFKVVSRKGAKAQRLDDAQLRKLSLGKVERLSESFFTGTNRLGESSHPGFETAFSRRLREPVPVPSPGKDHVRRE